MIRLQEFENELMQILETVQHIFDLESAIFDDQARLVACTPGYAKHKGDIVHAPSVQEVIYKDHVITHKPGHLPSCLGCRFKDNCPARIELLKSIPFGNSSVGVISFTSFSDEGHNQIRNNPAFYETILEDFSKIITILISRKYNIGSIGAQRAILHASSELTDDGLICADSSGHIIFISDTAVELFGADHFCAGTLLQLFPDNVVDLLLGGSILSNYSLPAGDYVLQIFSSPIHQSDVLVGTMIRVVRSKHYPKESAAVVKNNAPPFSLDSLMGDSAYMYHLKRQVKRIANSSSSVFISGETGTGKGLLAKAIHYESNRRHKPFLSINCTSIPDSLFESEFFGYDAGAFTGAKKGGKPGKFELADEGTLFLDEISEMSPDMQSKLLGVLQEGRFERVGGISPINVDVRVITASNADIEQLIEDKRFRADLFYRINVIPIRLLPLRERQEDIPILANNFLKAFNRKLNRKILGFDSQVMDLFLQHRWPGNIRQLENIIEYCVNVADKDIITPQDLPMDYFTHAQSVVPPPSGLKDLEYNLILETVNKYDWSVKGKQRAAAELGIGLRTLYRKLGKYGSENPSA